MFQCRLDLMRQTVLALLSGAALLCGCSPDTPTSEYVGSAVYAAWADGDPAKPIDAYVMLHGPSVVEVIAPKLGAAGEGLDDPEIVALSRRRLAEIGAQHAVVRPQLIALGAHVVGEVSRVANLIHIQVPRGQLGKIASLPHVVELSVVPLMYTSLKTGIPLVGAPGAWSMATPFHGDHISVGILDTGIDYLHGDLGGSGDPMEFENDDSSAVEPGSFPTARVLGGFDFVGNDYNPDDDNLLAIADADPIDCNGHGSHVAGIAAGNGVLADGSSFSGPYDQSFDPATFLVAPGVAPRADLYAIKIFGCDGPSGFVTEGVEFAADPNMDGDMSDRLDVVNASLGSAWGLANPGQTIAIRNYTELGGLFVASAGNEGATTWITGAPAAFEASLSVAASVDRSFSTLTVNQPASIAGDYAASEAQFSERLDATGPIAANVVAGSPLLGCDPFINPSEIAGNIVYVDRGECFFLDKFVSAEAAGAIGVIVANHTFGGGIFSMAAPEEGGTSSIVGVMVSAEDGVSLKEAIGAGNVNVTLSPEIFSGEGRELIAGLSSRGPRSRDGKLKPEIAAPGVSVDSADVGSGNAPTPKSGTSMASPFVAGAAALALQSHPTFDPVTLKSLLMNTTQSLHNEDGVEYPVSMQGAGRVNVARVVTQSVTARTAEPGFAVAVSFQTLSPHQPTSESRDIELRNHGPAAVDYAISAAQTHPRSGVAVRVSPDALTIAPGETKIITLTMDVDPQRLGAPESDPILQETQFDLPRQWLVEGAGHVRFDDANGEQSLTLPFHSMLQASAWRQTAVPRACVGDGQMPVLSLAVEGDSPHPQPMVSAFQLGSRHEMGEETNDTAEFQRVDLRADGIASNFASAKTFEEVAVHFAIVVEGPWTTPARGTLGNHRVEIDADANGEPDFVLAPQAFNRDDDPWGDVLLAEVFDVSECDHLLGLVPCDATGSKRYLNFFAPNFADVRVFNSNVGVMSAMASEIGMSEDQTVLRYRVITIGRFGVQDQGDYSEFDIAHPTVDAAKHAPLPGTPVYFDGATIQAEVDPDADDDKKQLLVLHHNNVPSATWEIVDVSNHIEPTIEIAADVSPPGVAGKRVVRSVTITNPGTQSLDGVSLTGSIVGGDLVLVTSTQGDCSDTLSCVLGTIEPGASVTLSMQIETLGDAASVDVAFAATTALGCDGQVTASFPLMAPDAQPFDENKPLLRSGGCGCELAPSTDHRGWLLLLLGAALLRRRIASRATD